MNSGGEKRLEHAAPRPGIPFPDEEGESGAGRRKTRIEVVGGGPFEAKKAGIVNRMFLG